MKTLKKLGSKSGVAACAAALFIGVIAVADGSGSGSGSSDPCASGTASCDCDDNGTKQHTCCTVNHCKISSWDVSGPFGVTIHHCSVKCT